MNSLNSLNSSISQPFSNPVVLKVFHKKGMSLAARSSSLCSQVLNLWTETNMGPRLEVKEIGIWWGPCSLSENEENGQPELELHFQLPWVNLCLLWGRVQLGSIFTKQQPLRQGKDIHLRCAPVQSLLLSAQSLLCVHVKTRQNGFFHGGTQWSCASSAGPWTSRSLSTVGIPSSAAS